MLEGLPKKPPGSPDRPPPVRCAIRRSAPGGGRTRLDEELGRAAESEPAALDRPVAKRTACELGQIARRGPADVAAPRALALVERTRQLAHEVVALAATEALDGDGRHMSIVGAARAADYRAFPRSRERD